MINKTVRFIWNLIREKKNHVYPRKNKKYFLNKFFPCTYFQIV